MLSRLVSAIAGARSRPAPAAGERQQRRAAAAADGPAPRVRACSRAGGAGGDAGIAARVAEASGASARESDREILEHRRGASGSAGSGPPPSRRRMIVSSRSGIAGFSDRGGMNSPLSSRMITVPRVVARERAPAGRHLVEHAAEREEVGARVDLGAGRLLGRHVGRRADRRTGHRDVRVGRRLHRVCVTGGGDRGAAGGRSAWPGRSRAPSGDRRA